MLNESNHKLKKSQKELAEILPAYASQLENVLTKICGIGNPELGTSSYLLPDGKLFNIGYEGHPGMQDTLIDDLPEKIQEYIGIFDEKDEANDDWDWFDEITDNRSSILELAMPGTIRLNSSHYYIGLSGPITTAQQNVLVAWLDLVHADAADNWDSIEIWYEDTTTSSKIKNFDPHKYSVDELIKVIKYLGNAKKFSSLHEDTETEDEAEEK